MMRPADSVVSLKRDIVVSYETVRRSARGHSTSRRGWVIPQSRSSPPLQPNRGYRDNALLARTNEVRFWYA